MAQKIINIANRLPVTIDGGLKRSSGGLVSALDSVKDDMNLEWIGWPGCIVDNESEKEKWKKELKEEFDYTPVFLSETLVHDYYDGYANACLWPTFHYIPNYIRSEEGWWGSYVEANQLFADAVLERANPGDIIWVHDYHLMLVPQMVRAKMKDVIIGFFLHTPFPSYEVFRCLPEREALLEGILGADLIGFHTYGYMRHFGSCIMRVLSLETEMGHLRYQDRDIKTGVFPIGINSQRIIQELESVEYMESLKGMQKNYVDKRIILNVERLDYTKGIPTRLQAIDSFLSEASEDVKDNIVFIFVAVPSRGEVSEYQDLRDEVEGLVGRINGKHATLHNVPLHFIHKSVSFPDLCALYSLADVMLVTPYIDGMNLVAKEYVACRKEGDGVLILSEFAGAAEELFNSILVNPYDVDGLKRALHTALDMSREEMCSRMQYLRERVLDFDASYWAHEFMKNLKMSKIGEEISDSFMDICPLAKKHLASGENQGLFLDYDGTLREFEKKPGDAFPHQALESLFDELEEKFAGKVYIISGRSGKDLKNWMGHRNFTLIPEHGYAYCLPGEDEFNVLKPSADFYWKDHVREVLHYAVGTTPGSFVEEKRTSLVWHYRSSDPEYGKWKAQQLVSELYEMSSNIPVEVHHGKKIVEVSSIQVNKGIALEEMMAKDHLNKVICIGDDMTDESMFRLENDDIMSIKVGVGETLASYRIKHPDECRKLIKFLLEN